LLTVSATEMVSFRAFRRADTSLAAARRAGVRKVLDMVVTFGFNADEQRVAICSRGKVMGMMLYGG